MKAKFCKYTLQFRQPAITSRQVMLSKPTYFLKVWREENPEIIGTGECGLFPGLSSDDVPDYEDRLRQLCANIENPDFDIEQYPSIKMGLTTAVRDLESGSKHMPWPSYWSEGRAGIKINGLVWMGSREEMSERIKQKLASGFRCIKLKIGGINFEDELQLIEGIRKQFPADLLEIRLDANGAFTPENALTQLERLAPYGIHSLEQPIRQGQWVAMADICRNSPIDIALDEELIGITCPEIRRQMLQYIAPQYVILKPTLCGGFEGADNWIDLAQEVGAGWWATSALESNIGLNAIAQWVSAKGKLPMVQGLGTGNLYTNNIDSPLYQHGDCLFYNTEARWKMPEILKD